QGSGNAESERFGNWQDCAQPHHRYQSPLPASARYRDQAGPLSGIDSLHGLARSLIILMRGIVEYAMSGRRQAATVAVLFGLIPMLNLLSGAVVALVILRKGMQDGLLVLLWALLPAGLQWVIGDTMPVFMLIG